MILFIRANTAFFNNLVLSLGLGKPCFSLADSNGEIYSTRKCPLVLLSNDEGLKILMTKVSRYVRDETHRFGHDVSRPICAQNYMEGYKDDTQPVLNAI